MQVGLLIPRDSSRGESPPTPALPAPPCGQDGELRLRTVYRLDGAAPSLARDLAQARASPRLQRLPRLRDAPRALPHTHTPQTCLHSVGQAWTPLANAVHDLSALVERQPADAAPIPLDLSVLQPFITAAAAAAGPTGDDARAQ